MPLLTTFTARSLGTQQMPSGAWQAQLPRPLAAHSRAGPSHAGWVCGLQLVLGLTNNHLRSNSMTLSLTKKTQTKTKQKSNKKILFENEEKSQN